MPKQFSCINSSLKKQTGKCYNRAYKYIANIKNTKVKFSQLYLTMTSILLCLSREVLNSFPFPWQNLRSQCLKLHQFIITLFIC